jgi:hypothetical protein
MKAGGIRHLSAHIIVGSPHGVRVGRQDGQALGPGYGSFATDARGPFEVGQGRRLLARRQAGGVRAGRPDGQVLESLVIHPSRLIRVLCSRQCL